MFPVDVFRSTIQKLVVLLKPLGIRFHLTGGLTTIYYGEPRLTQDIDVVIDNQQVSSNLETFLRSLGSSDFIHNTDSVREAIESKGMFQLLDSVESLKLDIYPRELVPGELDRSVHESVFDGEELPIASRTDAAISKLIWISKGSHKSRRDFRKIYFSSAENERNRIDEFAESLELKNLADTVIAEPDEIE